MLLFFGFHSLSPCFECTRSFPPRSTSCHGPLFFNLFGAPRHREADVPRDCMFFDNEALINYKFNIVTRSCCHAVACGLLIDFHKHCHVDCRFEVSPNVLPVWNSIHLRFTSTTLRGDWAIAAIVRRAANVLVSLAFNAGQPTSSDPWPLLGHQLTNNIQTLHKSRTLNEKNR